MLDRLFWEKYRPKAMNKMVLLPRIKEIVTDKEGNLQVPTNLILTGPPGTGKSTLARMIEAKHDTLTINASLKSSVDDLKGEVQEFCQTMNIFGDEYASGLKIVFLDEFDGVSRQFQEGLRGFIEEYEQRVRFVATCNNVSKITDAMLSRFTVVDFAPRTANETAMLRQGYVRRAIAVCKAEEMDIAPAAIEAMVNSSFPDYRAVFNKLQIAKARGTVNVEEIDGNTDAGALYAMVTGQDGPEAIYDYVLAAWGDKVDGLISLLGRPFARWIFANAPAKAFKVVELLPLIRDYELNIGQATDPAMHAMALMGQVQAMYNK